MPPTPDAAPTPPGDAWAYAAVAARLRARLADGALRPGHDAHLTMAPSHRLDHALLSVEGKAARQAATLVLVYGTAGGEAAVLLTVRPETLRDHGGQVAFPGGRLDDGETALDAALREAREEVGLDAASVEVVGAMTPLYVPPTRFSVTPVVALAPSLPPLVPAPDEVAALLPAPLGALFDPANRHVAPWDTAFGTSDVPHHRADDALGVERRIWGATAMMLAELRALAAP